MTKTPLSSLTPTGGETKRQQQPPRVLFGFEGNLEADAKATADDVQDYLDTQATIKDIEISFPSTGKIDNFNLVVSTEHKVDSSSVINEGPVNAAEPLVEYQANIPQNEGPSPVKSFFPTDKFVQITGDTVRIVGSVASGAETVAKETFSAGAELLTQNILGLGQKEEPKQDDPEKKAKMMKENAAKSAAMATIQREIEGYQAEKAMEAVVNSKRAEVNNALSRENTSYMGLVDKHGDMSDSTKARFELWQSLQRKVAEKAKKASTFPVAKAAKQDGIPNQHLQNEKGVNGQNSPS